MFNNKDRVIDKVLNPLEITAGSIIEFNNVSGLQDTGFYRFKKIIEMHVGSRTYVRYLIYSKSEDTEYIFEVFPGPGGKKETYLYGLADTIPFSEEFLDVVGQLYLTDPEGNEYKRCVMPDNPERIEGVTGKVKVYDIESGAVEREVGIKLWDYEREAEGIVEYLNVEMMEDSGMFRIFTGEMVEEVFYKLFQGGK